uniref:Uncharacterized protein n=1 Tax=Vitis vinifera TaxID=29760 RepID=F6HZX8_VITVI
MRNGDFATKLHIIKLRRN